MNENILEIKNLSKNYYIHHNDRIIDACKDISFSVGKGEFIGITGKSGSGKTTILKSIYRTNSPQRGSILYNSEKYGIIDLAKADEQKIIYLRKYEIAYVSQFLRILPRITAFQSVIQEVLKVTDNNEKAKEDAEYILDYFEVDRKLWDVYPNSFSGGEKLRLNIAMAMVKKPRLLLLDEPTASLDYGNKLKVKELIMQLKKEGCTMIGIFHDLEFMEGVCDYEFNMEKGVIKND